MAIPIIGKIIDKVIDKGGDIISQVVTDKDLANQLEHEFRSQLSRENHEIKELEIEADKEFTRQTQETARAELHQSDIYTKRTRPIIARRSFYAGLAYMLLTSLPESGISFMGAILMPWQFQWEVLLLAYSPALTYMGVRGFEKWKSGGSS